MLSLELSGEGRVPVSHITKTTPKPLTSPTPLKLKKFLILLISQKILKMPSLYLVNIIKIIASPLLLLLLASKIYHQTNL